MVVVILDSLLTDESLAHDVTVLVINVDQPVPVFETLTILTSVNFRRRTAVVRLVWTPRPETMNKI